MGRAKKGVMEERKETFRTMLKENKSEGEMQEELNLSDSQIQTLMGTAARERWPELKGWNPSEDVIQAKKLPEPVQQMVMNTSGVKDRDQCRLIRVLNEKGTVTLRCVGSEKDEKALAADKKQKALPVSRTAGALPRSISDNE